MTSRDISAVAVAMDTESAEQPTPPSADNESIDTVSVDTRAKKAENMVPVAEKSDSQQQQQQPFDREKAEATFRQLLKDTNIPSDMDWNTAIKKIANDEKFKSLRTHAERRSVFERYIEDKRDQERRDAIAKRRKVSSLSFIFFPFFFQLHTHRCRSDTDERAISQIETDFLDMLSELTGENAITYNTSYRQMAQVCSGDPRFIAVENATERLELYDRYLYDLDRRERREMEERRVKTMGDFRHLLVQRAEMGHIKYDSLWRNVKDLLRDEELYKSLDEVDRFQIWDSFISDLTKIEEEKHILEREKKKRESIMCRAQFWKLLEQAQMEGKITVATRWKAVKEEFKDHEAYIAVENDSGTIRPRDIFEEYIEELEGMFQVDMRTLKSIMRDMDIEIKEDTKLEEYLDAVSKDERFKTLHSAENAKVYHEDMLESIKERKERRRKRRGEKLKELLRDTPGITADTTYQDAKKILSHSRAFVKLDDDDELREHIFKEYIGRLSRKRESSSTSSSSRKRGRESEDRDADRRERRSSRGHSHGRDKRPKHESPAPVLTTTTTTTQPSAPKSEAPSREVDEFQRRIEQLAKRKEYLLSLKNKMKQGGSEGEK